MEYPFGSGKRKSAASEMRQYNPAEQTASKKTRSALWLPASAKPRSQIRFSTVSKIMILVSVFLVALTALISLFGAAEYARIMAEIAAIESDIETYEQQISQVKKTQSSMNDYASITDACLDRGMQMIWEPDSTIQNP